jgi:two-component system sensor histidine kinase KdpD
MGVAMPPAQPTDVTRLLSELARDLGSALDPSSVLERALAALRPVLPLRGGAVWLAEGDRLRLVVAVPTGLGDEPDLTAPLLTHGQDTGVLALHLEPGAEPDAEVRLLVEAVAVQVAAALERGRLFQEVMELERLKTDFIARVSHELRTPITIIHGFIDTMLAHEERLDAEQRRHMLQRSQSAAARLARLIEELLIVSRLEAGVLTPDPSPLVIADVLEEVRASAAEPTKVTVTGYEDATLRTDRAMLARAIGCVVDNALKYGGTAEISVAPAEREGLAGWSIEVHDRGAGFDDEVKPIAFEMFTRGPETTAIPGLGVGLAIARTLLEVLDGDIAIEDVADGPGALVRLYLPA